MPYKQKFTYEINMVLRNKRGLARVAKDGKPLRKTCKTNSPRKIAAFYHTNGFAK